MMILHVVPGLDAIGNGMSVAAHLIADAAGDALIEARRFANGNYDINSYDEIWVHSCWLPSVLRSCIRVSKTGKKLVCMPHGNLDLVRLRYHAWKKWLVGPIERWCLRRCDRIVATCEAEKGWIQAYLGKHCPPIEVTDIKRFFRLPQNDKTGQTHFIISRPMHLLYLGRRHPLKGLDYLLSAIRQLDPNLKCENDKTGQTYFIISQSSSLQLKVVSNAFYEEKERIWDWCDILVLPTLSENFGLVIAEALERGKCVITTDGAPAWGDGNDYGGRLIYLKGYRDGTDEERVELLKRAIERICK